MKKKTSIFIIFARRNRHFCDKTCFLGFFWILLKKVLVVLVMLVDSVSSVVLVITFHVIR